jgi:hypothetical protein
MPAYRTARKPQKTVMSIANVENIVRIARQQMSQRDINESLLKAVIELTAECKRLDDEVRRVRREAQMGRRFG